MLGASTEREIVIGPCMTALTLHMSRSIGRELSPGDEIIVTRMDHEGDISPWLHLAQDRGLVVKWLPFNRDTWVPAGFLVGTKIRTHKNIRTGFAPASHRLRTGFAPRWSMIRSRIVKRVARLTLHPPPGGYWPMNAAGILVAGLVTHTWSGPGHA